MKVRWWMIRKVHQLRLSLFRMSRSRRKVPIFGLTADSDKDYKVSQHRAERRHVRSLLATRQDGDDRRLYAKRYGNWQYSNKDGKVYGPENTRRK